MGTDHLDLPFVLPSTFTRNAKVSTLKPCLRPQAYSKLMLIAAMIGAWGNQFEVERTVDHWWRPVQLACVNIVTRNGVAFIFGDPINEGDDHEEPEINGS